MFGYTNILKDPIHARPEDVISQMAHAMATAHNAARRFALRQVKKTPIALDDQWLVHTLRHWQLKLTASLDEHCISSGACSECIGILEQLRCTRYPALPRLPIHGDMCVANVVFSGRQLMGIIDFGHCCSDTAVRDITIALRYECAKTVSIASNWISKRHGTSCAPIMR